MSSAPAFVMSELLMSFWTSACLITAAKLGLADLLASGPKTPSELAAATGTQAEPLFRLLRALASKGVFAEDDEGRFALTPTGLPARSGGVGRRDLRRTPNSAARLLL